ncbi:MAG: UvrD-helicase domain-containing protein [Bacteroidetes bacterium]|nr:UvrD-helicase domain-containing protein [Bacteroidota bacterium]
MAFIVYKSSAGSGKTFTLVKEYLNLVLLDPGKYRRILAITFTHKAAAEMRGRILSTLEKFSHPDQNLQKGDKTLMEKLTQSTGLPEEEIRSRSVRVLGLILHNFSDFAISTIDSFIYRIIRSFSFDLRYPANFEVELDTESFISRAVDILLSRVGKDEMLTKILVKFTGVRTDEEKNWNIEHNLQSFASHLLREEIFPHLSVLTALQPEDLLSADQKMAAFRKKFEAELINLGLQAYDVITASGLSYSAFYQGNRGIMRYFEYLRDGRIDKIEPNSYVKDTVGRDSWAGSKTDPADAAKIEQIKPELLSIYRKIETLRETEEGKYHLLGLLRQNIYPVAVLNEFLRVFLEIRHDENLIHISEFNKSIADVIMKEPVPFVYERVGEKYEHYLVDEFQDTSELQWTNLIPLFENTLAYGRFNMLVGDAKQAIYRWRSGDVEQFIALPGFSPNHKGLSPGTRLLFKEQGKVENLDENYRSKQEIVSFNNDFFSIISELFPPLVKDVFGDVQQKVPGNKHGGYVQIRRFDKGFDKESYEAATMDSITSVVRDLLDSGFALNDIAVITRKNISGSRIASHLLSQGYRVVSGEALLLRSSPKVRFVVALLKLLVLPYDEVSMSVVIRYLSQDGRFGDKSLHDMLNLISNGNEKAGLNNIMGFAGIDFNTAKLKALTVYDLVEEIIRNCHLNEDFDPYLQFFLDSILQADVKRKLTLRDWLKWWEQNEYKQAAVLPEDSDAIRIMTIHKAKGLQFPAVIFPFADLDINNKTFSRKESWIEPEENEGEGLRLGLIPLSKSLEKTRFAYLYREEFEKTYLDVVNMAYVAMTRPSERLYIMLKGAPESGEGESFNKMIDFYLGTKGLPIPDSYEHGTKENKTGNAQITCPPVLLKSMISSNWHKRILISLNTPGQWDVSDPEGKRQKGNTLHRIMAGIRSKSDLEEKILQLQKQKYIEGISSAMIISALTKLLDNPSCTILFEDGWSVLNEQEITLENGQIVRPDRLLLKENRIRIFDFKTGSPDETHKLQIRNYADILHQMGYIIDALILVYLEQEEGIVRL